MSEGLKRITHNDLISRTDFVMVEPTNEKVTSLVHLFEKTVFGQTEACIEVARSLTRSLAGFVDPHRPQFVGLFLGETGVGKTEMGRAIANVYKPKDPNLALTIIDCSQFQQDFDTTKLTGAPPAYIGYGDPPLIDPAILTQKNVIIFDEIEKAHPALYRLMLQIMDKGYLETNTSAADEKNIYLNFSLSTIILTSNLGSAEIRDARDGRNLGFNSECIDAKPIDSTQIGLKAVKSFWRQMPEFLNRLDVTVVFKPLTPPTGLLIIDKFLSQFSTYCHRRIAATQEMKVWLLAQSGSIINGREIKRQLNQHLITPAAEVALTLPPGLPLIADKNETGQVVFWVSKSTIAKANRMM